MKKIFVTLLFLILLFLSGCRGINPGSTLTSPPTIDDYVNNSIVDVKLGKAIVPLNIYYHYIDLTDLNNHIIINKITKQIMKKYQAHFVNDQFLYWHSAMGGSITIANVYTCQYHIYFWGGKGPPVLAH